MGFDGALHFRPRAVSNYSEKNTAKTTDLRQRCRSSVRRAQEKRRGVLAEFAVGEDLVVDVDDEDLLPPDNLVFLAVVHLLSDDDVQDGPAVVQ